MRKKKTQILTDTPIKDQIVETLMNNKKRVKRNLNTTNKKTKLIKRIKGDTSSES